MKTIKKITRETMTKDLVDDYAETILDNIKYGDYTMLYALIMTRYVEMENDELSEHYASAFGEDIESLEVID